MLSRLLRGLRPRSAYDVMAAIACFGVLAGGKAYAANTINSTDIVDGQVKSVDVANQDLTGGDIKDGSLTTLDLTDGAGVAGADVLDGSLTGFDIKDGQIGQVDIADTAINSAKVADNSLTGTDINESTLSMPPTTTATFAGTGAVAIGNTMTKVVGKNLPAGSWAITATATMQASAGGAGPFTRTATCELRNGANFIGGTSDRRVIPASDNVNRSLSMNGGAHVPTGGGEVSLWCDTQGQDAPSQQFNESVSGSQMMMTRLDGFS